MLIDGGRGRVPAKKFGLLATAGGRTATSFADRKGAPRGMVLVANPGVARLQFDICAEKDSLWWNSHHGPELKTLGSMPWCSFPWQKLLPRPAQGLFSVLKWMLIERWARPSMLSSMCQHVARLQFDSCAKKQSLCGTVMMAWIWHVWINAIVFVPAAKAPPKAGAKELSYNCLNLAYSGQQHPCFGPNWFIQFCHIWRWIRYA